MPSEEIYFDTLAKFQDKQKEAWFTLLSPECKYLLYGGAAFGGKSYFLRWAAIGLGMYYYAKYGFKHIPIGLFSEDYPTLKDRQVVRMKNEIPPFLGRLTESRDEGYAFIGSKNYGEFIVLLRNLDDPSKYASTEFAAVLVEELTKNKETTFDDLRFRLRLPGISDVKFIGATNPGSIGHGWVKRKWIKQDPTNKDIEQDRFFFVPAYYTDNKFTTRDYELQLEALPTAKRKAFKDGDWDVFAGQFFDEWNEKAHVVKTFIPPKGALIVGGMDWGREKPFSCHLSTIEKVFMEDITFYRSRTFLEVYGTNKNPDEWGKEIKKKLDSFGLSLNEVSWISADGQIFNTGNDNSKSIADQFIDCDPRYRSILKMASKDRIPGWVNLHNWLKIAPDGKPYWQIAEHCVNLIRTLPELVHDKNIVEDVDSDGEDHAGDDQRYEKKRLKWLDGFSGGVVTNVGQTVHAKKPAIIKDGKQQSIDLTKFEKSEPTATGRVISR